MSRTSDGGRARPVLYLLPGLLCDRASWADVAGRLEPLVDCRVPDYSAEHSLGAMAEASTRAPVTPW